MPELRPFHLPKLVPARTAATSSTEDVTATTELSNSIQSSSVSFWTTSESSTPPTPTFSVRGHSRFPSSSSSLTSSSTSPIFEQADVLGSTSKLPMPKLAEDPTEHEENITGQDVVFQDPFSSYHLDSGEEAEFNARSNVILRESQNYDLESGFFGDEPEVIPPRTIKRQKSGDSGLNSISSRLVERFPSFTKRWRERKPSKLITGTTVQVSSSSRPTSSRSSSQTSASFHGFDQNEPAFSAAADISAPASPVEMHRPERKEPIDRHRLASTPLLPPLMTTPPKDESSSLQHLLQSPTMADRNRSFSSNGSPVGTPQVLTPPSPPLSAKPSISSFHRARTSTLPGSTDVPPLFISDPTDEWSIKLGHANFSIEPVPYIPDVCDANTCRQLVADWELARTNYFRHKHRTIEHYGVNSKTFKFTEQKWAEIDAEWRRNNDLVTAQAAINSSDAVPITPTEPALLTMMPTLNDPRSEGKFPKLGDQDIVGPMVQIAARSQAPPHSPRKVTTFFRNVFGRSRSATVE